MKIKKSIQVFGIIISVPFFVVGCGEGNGTASVFGSGKSVYKEKAGGVELGDLVKIHYILKDGNGQVLDSTYEREQLFGFTIGTDSVSKTLQKGILGMKVKQKKKIKVMAEEVTLSPSPKWIHPKNILTYEIKVVKIRGR